MNKFEKQKGAVPIIAVIILMAVIGGAAYVGQKLIAPSKKPGPESASEPSPKPPMEVNFTETGNTLNWDSRTESYLDEWTLLYEKPTNPAISVKLEFDENSLCNLGEGEEPCDKNKLNNGDLSQVKGNRVADTVTVIKLEKL